VRRGDLRRRKRRETTGTANKKKTVTTSGVLIYFIFPLFLVVFLKKRQQEDASNVASCKLKRSHISLAEEARLALQHVPLDAPLARLMLARQKRGIDHLCGPGRGSEGCTMSPGGEEGMYVGVADGTELALLIGGLAGVDLLVLLLGVPVLEVLHEPVQTSQFVVDTRWRQFWWEKSMAILLSFGCLRSIEREKGSVYQHSRPDRQCSRGSPS
jgi:hypothetical protein